MEELRGTRPNQLSLWAGSRDDHANHTHKPVNGSEKMTSAICGPKCVEQLERFSHVGLWAKTFVGLLIGMEGWYSTRCRLTWKMRATRSHRFYFQLQVSTLPTDGIGFGLLPTPKTMDGMAENVNSGKELKQTENGCFVNIRPTDGMRFGASLNDIAKNGLLPTPVAMEDRRIPNGSDLVSTMHKATSQTGKTSQLNPLFVAEMQGFPPDWTILPFQSGETNQ